MPIQPTLAMDRIEQRLQRLQIEFQRFFSGALDLPPAELTESLQTDFRTLRSSGRLSVSESYRLGALEARFTSYSQLHQRRLRDGEIRAPSRRRQTPAPAATSSGPAAGSETSAASGVLVGRADGPQTFDRLYEDLYPETEGGQRKVDRKQFSTYVDGYVKRIQKKTGCDQVRLQVVSEDGRRRLKVRAIHPSPKSLSGSGSGEA